MTMKLSKPIMSLMLLSCSVSAVSAGQDWDAARLEVAEQIATSEQTRLQQQQRLHGQQADLSGEAKQERHQYRWQKRQQDRLGVSIHASNSAGHTTMSGKGPR